MPLKILNQIFRIILISFKPYHSLKLCSNNNWNSVNQQKNIGKITLLRTYGYECITHQSCWKCGQSIEPEMEQYFCVCGVVQPPIPDRSYFQIMGLQQKFDLDLKLLNDKFRKLQVILHPDKYGQKSEEEKNFSYKHSVYVNNAYETLRDPLKRGFYLLRLDSLPDNELQIKDLTFLDQIFSLNEQLMCMTIEEDKERLATFKLENNNSINELINQITLAFKTNNDEQAKELLLMLKYRENLKEKINEFSD